VTQRGTSRANGGESTVVVLPRRFDTLDKADFWPPELAAFDEDYWAARSEVPGDTPPESLALWRTIFATRAYYQARQEWAREHGGHVLDEILAHAAAKRKMLEQMPQENPSDWDDAA
jgi:hypothetical protein